MLSFGELVGLYDKLGDNSKRLTKTYYISEFLKKCSDKDIPMVVLLMQGKLFVNYDTSKIGIATNMAIKAISTASGHSEKDVIEKWKKLGDLGECARELFSKKKQQTTPCFISQDH